MQRDGRSYINEANMQIRYKPGRLAAATIIEMDPEP
jgi:hypothetical protein